VEGIETQIKGKRLKERILKIEISSIGIRINQGQGIETIKIMVAEIKIKSSLIQGIGLVIIGPRMMTDTSLIQTTKETGDDSIFHLINS
jgi:hypothetical protein